MTQRRLTTAPLVMGQGLPPGHQVLLPLPHPVVMPGSEAEAEAEAPLPLEVAARRSSSSKGPPEDLDGRLPSAALQHSSGPGSAPALPTSPRLGQLPAPPLWRSGT